MPSIISYEDALKQAGAMECTLLLGNGFSIKYFNYRTLLDKSDLKPDDPVRVLFDRLRTVDFERVVRTLETAVIVERAYDNDKHADTFESDANRLRQALVHSVRGTHPVHREDIEDVIPSCVDFLSPFKRIFTLNYDLLLYWVILSDTNRFADGFGLGAEANGFRGPFKPDAHCNIFNLHGGLHLFRTSAGEIEKRLMGDTGIIDAIARTITVGKRFPLYVAEGTSPAKVARINATAYLKHCYERLAASSGAFFVFGHSADPNDAHIYDALFRSKIEHLFFCVHQPSASAANIDGELARYKKRNKSAIAYSLVDSDSAHVWDRVPTKDPPV